MKSFIRRTFLQVMLMSAILISAICGCARSSPAADDRTSIVDANNPDIQTLLSVERALTTIIETALPAVVSVNARNVILRSGIPPDQSQQPGMIPSVSGAGFVFSEDGYIITSEHVVSGSGEITVTLFDGRRFKAQIIGKDASTDVAVLKIDINEKMPVLRFADSNLVKVGQFAIAIGNPLQLDFSVTFGIISAVGRSRLQYAAFGRRYQETVRYEDYIQTDAWVSKGNSGGPLINSRGELIGMNSMIRTINPEMTDGPGLAIPSNLVVQVAQELIEHGRVIRGWLGIRKREVASTEFQNQGKYDVGIKIMEVMNGSPAFRGGLRSGDIIVEYDGKKIESDKQFSFEVAFTPSGKIVPIKVIRGNQEKTLMVKIGEMPGVYSGEPEPNLPVLDLIGIRASNITGELKRKYDLGNIGKGVLITEVISGEPGAAGGLKTGMVIVGIEGTNVDNMNKLNQALTRAVHENRSGMVRFWVIEDGKRKLVVVDLEK